MFTTTCGCSGGLRLVSYPRAVPGLTYVEKYYRLHPNLAAATQDPHWLDRTLESEPPIVQRRLMAAELLPMSHLLRQAAARTEMLDDDAVAEQRRAARSMLSLGRVSRPRFLGPLEAMRRIVEAKHERYGEGSGAAVGTDLVLMVGVPDVWPEEGGAPHQGQSPSTAR
jgi:hypothetical protein